MTSCAQMPLVRGRSNSENLTFSFAVCCCNVHVVVMLMNKCKTKKSVRRRNKKKHSRTSPDVQFKAFSLTKKTRPKTDYKWIGKTISKIRSKKNRKNCKNQSEIAACEKTISEKANFCSNTVFSLYFKFRAKKFHAATPLAFSPHFLFRRDQNHYSNLTSKIMKICEQILKKKNIAGRIPETTRSETPVKQPSNYSSNKTCLH